MHISHPSPNPYPNDLVSFFVPTGLSLQREIGMLRHDPHAYCVSVNKNNIPKYLLVFLTCVAVHRRVSAERGEHS